jgi:hypothetical protein
MAVSGSFLTLLALAPTPVGDRTPAGARAAVESSTAVLIGLQPRLAVSDPSGPFTAAAGDCDSSPSPAAWPSARFTDRGRSRRGSSGGVAGEARADLSPVVAVSSPTSVDAVAVDLAGTGRQLDLRALSDPHVLRVIRS